MTKSVLEFSKLQFVQYEVANMPAFAHIISRFGLSKFFGWYYVRKVDRKYKNYMKQLAWMSLKQKEKANG